MLFYHAFLMIGGYYHSLHYKEFEENLTKDTNEFPTVTVLIPAHNEEVVIEETLQSMIELNYPKDKLEVIVINDASTDLTGEIVDEYALAYSFISVIHTEPPHTGKGKSGALNQGLARATGEVVIVYDADNTPEPDAVRFLALGLKEDEKAGAIVGKFRVVNAKQNVLTKLINIETLTFQWLAQAGRWFWFKMTTIPGTNFAIRKSILDELGGWDENALSEDTELSIRVYDLGYYIRFFPSAITWEQEPENLRVWWRQRVRWARGNLYVVFKYLLKLHRLNNKKVWIDLFYFLFTYVMFFGGVILSHILLIGHLFFDVSVKMGVVSYVLLIVGFLLFVTEVCLALSIERNQLTLKNFLIVLFMYFSYSQLWIFLVIYASILEIKRIIFRQEVKWYKTKRFKQSPKESA